MAPHSYSGKSNRSAPRRTQKLRTLISQSPEWQDANERERYAQQFCDGDPRLAVFAHALRRKAVSALAKARAEAPSDALPSPGKIGARKKVLYLRDDELLCPPIAGAHDAVLQILRLQVRHLGPARSEEEKGASPTTAHAARLRGSGRPHAERPDDVVLKRPRARQRLRPAARQLGLGRRFRRRSLAPGPAEPPPPLH